MKWVRVQMRMHVETAVERRDPIATIRDLNPRDHDVIRAKALGARMAARREEET